MLYKLNSFADMSQWPLHFSLQYLETSYPKIVIVIVFFLLDKAHEAENLQKEFFFIEIIIVWLLESLLHVLYYRHNNLIIRELTYFIIDIIIRWLESSLILL